jgi:hypothetical protein
MNIVLNLITNPPLYVGIYFINCLPGLPIYGLQGSITFRRIISSPSGNAHPPLIVSGGFFLGAEELLKMFFLFLIQLVA